ncbi:hypothetical protein IF1G_05902 [Cordyceps javanica]|uniref:Uncharacterized protein n=1 Tax=Cordyceps javanica TaxID=43265 RepID=A0A545UZL5_9HYPO|nr:hypothetical protein IF1G_05902 [Cordyceps javanica]
MWWHAAADFATCSAALQHMHFYNRTKEARDSRKSVKLSMIYKLHEIHGTCTAEPSFFFPALFSFSL